MTRNKQFGIVPLNIQPEASTESELFRIDTTNPEASLQFQLSASTVYKIKDVDLIGNWDNLMVILTDGDLNSRFAFVAKWDTINESATTTKKTLEFVQSFTRSLKPQIVIGNQRGNSNAFVVISQNDEGRNFFETYNIWGYNNAPGPRNLDALQKNVVGGVWVPGTDYLVLSDERADVATLQLVEDYVITSKYSRHIRSDATVATRAEVRFLEFTRVVEIYYIGFPLLQYLNVDALLNESREFQLQCPDPTSDGCDEIKGFSAYGYTKKSTGCIKNWELFQGQTVNDVDHCRCPVDKYANYNDETCDDGCIGGAPCFGEDNSNGILAFENPTDLGFNFKFFGLSSFDTTGDDPSGNGYHGLFCYNIEGGVQYQLDVDNGDKTLENRQEKAIPAVRGQIGQRIRLFLRRWNRCVHFR